MGSNETATATTGGPRVITYLTGTGCHRAQIIYFFRTQIGSRTRSGVGLGSGRRRNRIRWCLGLPRELWIENFGGSWFDLTAMHAAQYVSTDRSGRSRGVGACARLVPTISALRATSGPQIDRFPSTRPPWWRRQYRELKKLFFSAPISVPLISLDQ